MIYTNFLVFQNVALSLSKFHGRHRELLTNANLVVSFTTQYLSLVAILLRRNSADTQIKWGRYYMVFLHMQPSNAEASQLSVMFKCHGVMQLLIKILGPEKWTHIATLMTTLAPLLLSYPYITWTRQKWQISAKFIKICENCLMSVARK